MKLRFKILFMCLGCTLFALLLQTFLFQETSSRLIYRLSQEESENSLQNMQKEIYSFIKNIENIWSAFDTLPGTVAFLLTLFLTVIILCALLYVFPLMARFQNRFLQTIKNAFLFAVSNAGSSFLLLLIRILVAGLLYLFPAMKIFMMIAGFSLTARLDSLILTRLFSPYEAVS